MESKILKQRHIVIDDVPFINAYVRQYPDYIEIQQQRDIVIIHKECFDYLKSILNDFQ